MANDVKIGFGINDNASPGIKRIGGNIDTMTRFGMKGIQRMGGNIGEMGMNALGLGSAMGKVGIAFGAAFLISQSMNASMSKELENIKEQTEWQQKRLNIMRDAKKAQEAMAAGGISQARSVGKLLRMGGSMSTVEDTKALGVSHEDALAVEIGIRRLRERDRKAYGDTIRELVSKGIEPQKAIDSVVKNRGNAVNAVMDAEFGGRPSKENQESAWRFLVRNGPALSNISSAVAASGVIPGEQAYMLGSGQTTAAISQQNQRALDPAGTAIAAVKMYMEDTQRALQKQANAAEEVSNSFKNMLTPILSFLPGYNAWTELERFSKNAAAFGE